MANKEISELTNKATPIGTDEIEIQETGGGTSKKTSLQAVWDNTATNSISEKTAGSGVTVDSLLIKDGGITAAGTSTFAGQTITDLGAVTTVDLNGGSIDGTVIGGNSPAGGSFSTLSAQSATTLGGTLGVTGVGSFTDRITVENGAILIGDIGDAGALSNGNVDILRDTTNGFVFRGKGSTKDIDMRNGAGSTVMSVATGTTTSLFAGVIQTDSTTQSTSTTTGSLQTDGGLGVVKDAFIGGALNVTGTATLGTTLQLGSTGGLNTIGFDGVTTTAINADSTLIRLKVGGSNRVTVTSSTIAMSLPTSAGSAGELWNDSGTVKVA